MPKQQKQKQKQSQVTKVTVKVGDTTNKPKRKPRARPASAPAQRGQSGISLTLQGSSVAYPPAPTQQYNELVQQVEALRREMALSGSLISKAATNDIFNRVEATNPFEKVSKFVTEASLKKPEGVVEEEVEGLTTQDPAESHGYGTHAEFDQDWISNVALANKAQSLPALSKIGIVEDPETREDLKYFDEQEPIYQKRLTDDMDEFISGAKQRFKDRQTKELKMVRKARRKGQPIEFIDANTGEIFD